MNTDEYDDSEGPHDDDTWRMLCILVGIFIGAVVLTVIVACLKGC